MESYQREITDWLHSKTTLLLKPEKTESWKQEDVSLVRKVKADRLNQCHDRSRGRKRGRYRKKSRSPQDNSSTEPQVESSYNQLKNAKGHIFAGPFSEIIPLLSDEERRLLCVLGGVSKTKGLKED